MEKGNTKQEILDVALDLFSTQGYEATSISQITDRVGIRKSSMYSHFGSKQEILDALIDNVLNQYAKKSIFANANWNDPEFKENIKELTPETVLMQIVCHVRYILHDSTISKSRKMLTIEQFRNTQLAELQTKQKYTDVLKYFTGLIQFMIDLGKLKNSDVEIMAAELCLPITAWINICDRTPEREEEILALIERHVMQFFKIYQL